MNIPTLTLWMSAADLTCWIFCFWWMGRLSSKQNTLLDQLREQGRRIEKLSKAEHDLIKEVHPQVNEIRESMDAVKVAMEETAKKAS